ncbi:MAG TPA: DUF433 domain-containing protein [Chloroflexota bacterium]|nr:DUF433 domain-containing protein [Chloroflexota bacterium]HUM70446.1 DUF433 domain-containing protein [Chloroflexota bacterium]
MTLMVKTRYEHIVLDEQGIPKIAGTNTKVIEVVLDKIAYGWSAEEMHNQHPYLSLGQIHSALAYYWDHQETLDADMQRRLEVVEELQKVTPPTPFQEKLRQQGLL